MDNKEIDFNLNPREKLRQGRMKLQDNHPFFSNLALHLKLKEDKNIPSMGISPKGILYYNPKYVKEEKKHIEGLLAHEALHAGLNHPLREGQRNHKIWNIAADYIVNAIVKKNSLSLPEYALYNEEFLNEDVEKVYRKLMENAEEQKQKIGQCDSNKNRKVIDEHKQGQGLSKEEKKEAEREWKERMEKAVEYSQQRGDTPAGMDRLVDEILDNKLNYKQLLRKYIQQHIPFDYSYRRPAKKSYATGIYFPETRDESLDVVVAIDSSGSIGQQELKQFLGEINAINQSFQSVDLTILVGDTKLQEEHHFRNKNKIRPEELSLTGGGGTSHHWVFEWAKKNTNNTILVAFTDGYTEFPPKPNIDTIWVSTGKEPSEYPWGKALKCEVG